MTNLEKIRAMSVEELTTHLIKIFECVICPVRDADMYSLELPCSFNIKKWLLSESEVEE